MPTLSPEERRGIIAAVEAACDLIEKERFAAYAAAAQVLRDLITQTRCHVDGSATTWVGEWAFRIHMEGNDAWIEGGYVMESEETLAMRWESRTGRVAQPFLPMRTWA